MEPFLTTPQWTVDGPVATCLAHCVAVLLLCNFWCADLAPVVEDVEQQRAGATQGLETDSQKIHQCHRPFDVPQNQTTVHTLASSLPIWYEAGNPL